MVMASDCVGLTLPGMIDEPGSFSGRLSSPIPERGPLASQRRSFAIFVRLTARVASAALAQDDCVVRRQSRELVGRAHERRPGALRQARGHRVTEAGRGVEASAHGGAADGQLEQPGQHQVEPLDVRVELRHVAAELLAKGQRHRILQVRAADLDDVVELAAACGQRVAQPRDRRAAALR